MCFQGGWLSHLHGGSSVVSGNFSWWIFSPLKARGYYFFSCSSFCTWLTICVCCIYSNPELFGPSSLNLPCFLLFFSSFSSSDQQSFSTALESLLQAVTQESTPATHAWCCCGRRRSKVRSQPDMHRHWVSGWVFSRTPTHNLGPLSGSLGHPYSSHESFNQWYEDYVCTGGKGRYHTPPEGHFHVKFTTVTAGPGQGYTHVGKPLG